MNQSDLAESFLDGHTRDELLARIQRSLDMLTPERLQAIPLERLLDIAVELGEIAWDAQFLDGYRSPQESS